MSDELKPFKRDRLCPTCGDNLTRGNSLRTQLAEAERKLEVSEKMIENRLCDWSMAIKYSSADGKRPDFKTAHAIFDALEDDLNTIRGDKDD